MHAPEATRIKIRRVITRPVLQHTTALLTQVVHFQWLATMHPWAHRESSDRVICYRLFFYFHFLFVIFNPLFVRTSELVVQLIFNRVLHRSKIVQELFSFSNPISLPKYFLPLLATFNAFHFPIHLNTFSR